MDFITLFVIALLFLIASSWHREEVRRGNKGIPLFGPIFCDTFWIIIEAVPNGDQLVAWLDKRFKDHKEELRRKEKQPRSELDSKLGDSQKSTQSTLPTESPNIQTVQQTPVEI